jgi:hypothetical protein
MQLTVEPTTSAKSATADAKPDPPTLGTWTTARRYSRFFDVDEQVLANWRYRDKKAGREQALPGYPQYRRFGKAVRYFVPEDAKPADRGPAAA